MPPLKICRPGPGPRGPVRKYGPAYEQSVNPVHVNDSCFIATVKRNITPLCGNTQSSATSGGWNTAYPSQSPPDCNTGGQFAWEGTTRHKRQALSYQTDQLTFHNIHKHVIRTNKMHTFYINILIFVSSTCFEHRSVHPQEDLYMQLYGISFTHPYKQFGRWQDVLDTNTHIVNRLKVIYHIGTCEVPTGFI